MKRIKNYRAEFQPRTHSPVDEEQEALADLRSTPDSVSPASTSSQLFIFIDSSPSSPVSPEKEEPADLRSPPGPVFAVTLADLNTVSTSNLNEISGENRILFNLYLQFACTYADSLVKGVSSISDLKQFDFSSAIEKELSGRFSPFIRNRVKRRRKEIETSLNWNDPNLGKAENTLGDRTLSKIVQLKNDFHQFIKTSYFTEEDICLFESTQLGDLNLFGKEFLGDPLFDRIFSDITHSKKETLSALYLAQLVLLDHRQRILIMMLFDKAHFMSVKWDNYRLFARNAIYQFYVQKGIGIVSNGQPLPRCFWLDCSLYSQFLLSFELLF